MPRRDVPWLLVGLWWVAMVAIAVATRPYLPVDETRYLAVAWEMHWRGDYLVPHLNGVLYSHKPPLMFWLINAGWAMFGFNEWWPRIAVPLAALGALILTAQFARRLWPQQQNVASVAVLIAGGAALWVGFTTTIMFDLLLTLCVLLALAGVLAARQRPLAGWLLCGAGIGLGVLAKGPVVLLHALPVAVLAPWWMTAAPAGGWARWYGGITLGVALGAAIALAWAIPAAISGGDAFANELFWHQSANRMVKSFAHQRPFWWYLPALPLMLFPWLVWPPVWRGFVMLARGPRDEGVRFCLAWSLPVLAAFSFISGKQVHYLLPEFPAFALLAALGLSRLAGAPRRHTQWLVAGLLIAVAATLLLLKEERLASLVAADDRVWILSTAIVFATVGALLALVRPVSYRHGAALLASATVTLFLSLHVGLFQAFGNAYDMAAPARFLAGVQAEGRPVAHVGKYHGQFHFAGRLREPLTVIWPNEVRRWAEQHPEGFVVSYQRGHWQPPVAPVFVQRYRGQTVYFWRAADAAQVPPDALYTGGLETDAESD
ncbi:MAG: ArnT family glycosyltransferase [Burkholderiales bacterium]